MVFYFKRLDDCCTAIFSEAGFSKQPAKQEKAVWPKPELRFVAHMAEVAGIGYIRAPRGGE